jgi:hypothetical protein
MDVCPVCNHPIEATVLEGPRLIARPATPNSLSRDGRYLTVRRLLCECGERNERLYENGRLGLARP